jgi:acyl-ACP thioesterase
VAGSTSPTVTVVEALVHRPPVGRVFETVVRVRFGDCEPGGRLRLDALARILQDAGNDDFDDAGLDPGSPWVSRRSVVVAGAWPGFGDDLRLATWCGGLGSRWAERRSSVTTAGGASVEVATLWVHLDDSGRPARLPEWFVRTYGEAAGARTVSSRLHLGPPPSGATGWPWQVRASDLDVLGHVNNAVLWAPVEEELARRALVPHVVEVEFVVPVLAADEVRLVSDPERGSRFSLWLTVGSGARLSAAVDGAPAAVAPDGPTSGSPDSVASRLRG